MTEETKPTSSTVPHVYVAINKVQAALAKDGVTKSRKNKEQGYAFRGIDEIFNALAPYLAENGLCILPRILSRTVSERQTKSGGVLFTTIVEAEYDFIAVADSSKHTVRVYGEAMDTADKSCNKAMSAAYKYACLQTFCIPTEGENDADATTHQVAAAPQPQPVFPNESGVIVFQTSARQSFKEAVTREAMLAVCDKLRPQMEQLKASPSPAERHAVDALRKDINDRLEELKTEAAKPKSVADILPDDSIPF